MSWLKRFRKKPQPVAVQSVPAEPSLPQPSSLTLNTEQSYASLRHTFPHLSELNAVAITPDASFFAIASDSIQPNARFVHPQLSQLCPITIYEVPTHNVRATVSAHQGSVHGVALTEDAAFVASSDHLGVVHVSDGTTGETRTTLRDHRKDVTSVSISPAGDTLASASVDGTVRLWDVEQEKCRYIMREHKRAVTVVSMSFHAGLVLSAGMDCNVRVWDIRSGNQVFALRRHKSFARGCASDSDGFYIVSCAEDRSLLVWDARKQDVVRTFEAPKPLFACDISSDASRVVASGNNGHIMVHNVRDGDTVAGFASPASGKRISGCAISADGNWVVSASFDKNARLFELSPVLSEVMRPEDVTDGIVRLNTEIERVFLDYMNNGIPLQPGAVARAIDMDFNLRKVSKISQVYVGHLVVRTLLASGESFTDEMLGGAYHKDTFFYRKLYHKLSELASSPRAQEFIARILHDAAACGLLTKEGVNSILGDARVNEYVGERLVRLETVLKTVYREVTSHFASIESQMQKVAETVANIEARVDTIERKMDLAEKVQRYSTLVKLGLALIPIVGSAAMAFADGAGQLILSLDLASVVEVVGESVAAIGQTVVDLQTANKAVDGEKKDVRSEEEIQALALVQHAVSEEFLRKLSPEDRDAMIKGIEDYLSMSVKSIREEVSCIMAEHVAVEDPQSAKNEGKGGPRSITESDKVASAQSSDRIENVSARQTFIRCFGSDTNVTISYEEACKRLQQALRQLVPHVDLTEETEQMIQESLLSAVTDDGSNMLGLEEFISSGEKVIRMLE